jgi:nucleoid DNA-binding protein
MNRITSLPFLKQLGKKHNLSVVEVKGIIRSQFEYVSEMISSSDLVNENYNNIFLAGLGRFVVREYARTRIREKKERDGANNTS